MYGEPQKGSEFICLILKMLQIQPDKEIIVEFIKNDDFKYLRLVGAFYMRLVGRAVDIFQYLEPLYNDYRKVELGAGCCCGWWRRAGAGAAAAGSWGTPRRPAAAPLRAAASGAPAVCITSGNTRLFYM